VVSIVKTLATELQKERKRSNQKDYSLYLNTPLRQGNTFIPGAVIYEVVTKDRKSIKA
jgi:hypothetical protein